MSKLVDVVKAVRDGCTGLWLTDQVTGETFGNMVDAAIAETEQLSLELSWRAEGNANEYTIMRGGNWLAAIRLNGELMPQKQIDILTMWCEAYGAQPSRDELLQF